MGDKNGICQISNTASWNDFFYVFFRNEPCADLPDWTNQETLDRVTRNFSSNSAAPDDRGFFKYAASPIARVFASCVVCYFCCCTIRFPELIPSSQETFSFSQAQ